MWLTAANRTNNIALESRKYPLNYNREKYLLTFSVFYNNCHSM